MKCTAAPTKILLLAVALPVIGTGSFACDDREGFADPEMRSFAEALPPEREPLPDPDPEPTSSEAAQWVGYTEEDFNAASPWVVVYEMFPLPSVGTPYSGPEIADPNHGWPVHALQWKTYLHGSWSGVAAAYAAVSAISGLGRHVSGADEASLDAIEAGGAVFTGNPNGTWMEVQFNDPATTFVYAALVMQYWNSPVYLDATHNYPVGSSAYGSYSHSIALERIELTLQNAPDLLTSCGLPAGAPASVALTTVVNCNHAALLTDNLVSLWNDRLCIGCPGTNYVPYDPDVSLSTFDLVTAWWASLGNRGQIVFDPPEEATEEDLLGLAVLAEALADQLLVEGLNGELVLVRDVVVEPEPIEG